MLSLLIKIDIMRFCHLHVSLYLYLYFVIIDSLHHLILIATKKMRFMMVALQAMTMTDVILYPDEYAATMAEPEN